MKSKKHFTVCIDKFLNHFFNRKLLDTHVLFHKTIASCLEGETIHFVNIYVIY